MVTASMDPACHGHVLAGMGGIQFATGMSFVHDAPPMMLNTQDTMCSTLFTRYDERNSCRFSFVFRGVLCV
jgi:hypothetical protein